MEDVVLRPLDRPAEAAEADLVGRCVRGEASAQRELFRSRFAQVYATVYRLTGSVPEAEDLAQETFEEVFRSLRGFRGDARLATWIDRIAVRVACRHFGRRRGRPPVSLELVDDIPDHQPSFERRIAAREGIRRLYEVLSALTPASRVAFTLWAIDGRTISETARLTASTAVATKVRIWRARRAVEQRAADDPVLAAFLESGGRP